MGYSYVLFHKYYNCMQKRFFFNLFILLFYLFFIYKHGKDYLVCIFRVLFFSILFWLKKKTFELKFAL